MKKRRKGRQKSKGKRRQTKKQKNFNNLFQKEKTIQYSRELRTHVLNPNQKTKKSKTLKIGFRKRVERFQNNRRRQQQSKSKKTDPKTSPKSPTIRRGEKAFDPGNKNPTLKLVGNLFPGEKFVNRVKRERRVIATTKIERNKQTLLFQKNAGFF